MESNQKAPHETLENFLKLSYPANPKIPFIIDGLEVRMTKKFGRGIFTTRDLKPGDIISIEKPVITKMAPAGQYIHCANCMLSNKLNLLPCRLCASLMFCSDKCRDEINDKFIPEAYRVVISDEVWCRLMVILQTFVFSFGNDDKLLEFIAENGNNFKNWKKTIFDYDLSDEKHPDYKKNLLKSILSFYTPSAYEEIRKTVLKNDACKITHGNSKLHKMLKFIEHIGVVFHNNCMCVGSTTNIYGLEENEKMLDKMKKQRDEEREEFRFHPFSPLINYSCFPNIEKLVMDGRVVYFVVRPIKAGEQLFRSPT
jgi:hypothetical protein